MGSSSTAVAVTTAVLRGRGVGGNVSRGGPEEAGRQGRRCTVVTADAATAVADQWRSRYLTARPRLPPSHRHRHSSSRQTDRRRHHHHRHQHHPPPDHADGTYAHRSTEHGITATVFGFRLFKSVDYCCRRCCRATAATGAGCCRRLAILSFHRRVRSSFYFYRAVVVYVNIITRDTPVRTINIVTCASSPENILYTTPANSYQSTADPTRSSARACIIYSILYNHASARRVW